MKSDEVASQQSLRSQTHERREISLVLNPRTVFVDRRNSLLSLLIPNRHQLSRMRKVLHSPASAYFLVLGWILLTILFLLNLFSQPTLPSFAYLPVLVAYTAYFVLSQMSLISTNIIALIMQTFNFWYTIGHLIIVCICLIVLQDGNMYTVSFAFFLVVGGILLATGDAHAYRRHKSIRAANIIGFLIAVSTFLAIEFSFVDFNDLSFHKSSGKIELFSLRAQALESLSTVIFYITRVIYNMFTFGDSKSLYLSYYYNFEAIPTAAVVGLNAIHPIVPHNDDSREVSYVLKGRRQSNRKSNENGSISTNILPSENNVLPMDLESSHDDSLDRRSTISMSSVSGDLKMQVVVGIRKEIRVVLSSDDNIFHRFVLQTFPTFAMIYKSKIYTAIGLVLGILSIILLFPVAIGLMDEYENYVFATSFIGMMTIAVTVIQIIFTANYWVARRILKSFDYWYITWLCFKSVFCAGYLFSWDLRVISWIVMFFGFQWFMFLDSFPHAFRKASIIAGLGFLWPIGLIISNKLGSSKSFQNNNALNFLGLDLFTPRIAFSYSCLSLFIFECRFLWSYFQNPNRLLLVTENASIQSANAFIHGVQESGGDSVVISQNENSLENLVEQKPPVISRAFGLLSQPRLVFVASDQTGHTGVVAPSNANSFSIPDREAHHPISNV